MTKAGQITIADRFNGPLDSGNGGYSVGLLAGEVDGPAVVSLRSPVPLDRPLTVVSEGDGSMRALDGEIVVMEARPAPELDLEPPRSVSIGEAREAAGRYPGLEDGPFSRCFVCGRVRDDMALQRGRDFYPRYALYLNTKYGFKFERPDHKRSARQLLKAA